MLIERPYLLFLGDAHDQLAAKTAAGIAQWRRDWCLGQLRVDGCRADVGLPDLDLEQARERGARTLVIGVANRGGKIGASWQSTLLRALDLGFDIASGLHQRVADLPGMAERARALGRRIADVRHPQQAFEVGTGSKRPGKRLLTVGTDCSVGKMYASLALEAEMRRRGMKADFRATGQTGILIAGDGVSVDGVISDFVAGAAEGLSPANDPDHWDLVEGQGSLFHASFAGVSLGLLHGSQPDAMVLCTEPGRPHMRGLPGVPLPEIDDCISLNERCARLTNPAARVIGLACNTSALLPAEAARVMRELEDRHRLPCVDPVRTGVAAIVDRLDHTRRPK
ncbi:MAG TPA: N-acetyltransferase DgcN [Vicinamibacteria bacterium]|nr:N-acetyltransferase DgcN [Vicinamibacteria bacterium]